MPGRMRPEGTKPERLQDAKRVVIKIGSALLVNQASGRLHRKWLDSLTDDVAAMIAGGQEVLIVSSGSIALGAPHLGLKFRHHNLDESQAAAAVGQIRLAHAYEESLGRHGLTVAQILLTASDTEQRRRYLNARGTITRLLAGGAVPVINENDTVATSEICFGDNDRLAARVAQMISADCLVLLSDVDGLYTADPEACPDAALIPEVPAITAEIEAMAGKPRQIGVGSGGMITKIAAARIATAAGCHMVIMSGVRRAPLSAFAADGRGTWFAASGLCPQNARKQWIGGTLSPAGALTIDDGAVRALRNGGSLLPAGITHLDGSFARGDVVVIRDRQNREIARGLSAYSDRDARRIMGHNSRDIERLLGYRGADELIHRDNLVLTPTRGDQD
ncbi:MAG: glutamate 5-kinase [Sphingomonadales bacterium]